MKNVGPYIAIAMIAAAGHAWASAPLCGQPALGAEFSAPRDLAFPTFCAIPPAPKNTPSADAFKRAVVSERLAGAVIVRDTGPDTWTLAGTTDFLAGARREAEPPPPMNQLGERDTAAFVAKAKARAAPPAKPRRR